jgi:hypothetical protein
MEKVTPEEHAFRARLYAALDASMNDAQVYGTGFVKITNDPVTGVTFERVDPETVTVEVEFEPGDRAPEPENFE